MKKFQLGLANIQQTQEKLYKRNAKLEYSRNMLYSNIEENVEELEKCLVKIESDISKTQTALLELREKFISAVSNYQEKKKLLDKALKSKKSAEKEYTTALEETKKNFEEINLDIVSYIREITTEEIRKIKKELIDVITKNGEKEKIPFDVDVVSKASEFATEISKKEAECYIVIYDKTKKLLEELENNALKIERHRKWKRDNIAKLKFFSAEREYLIQFLDNERLPVMHGKKVHRKLMIEACKNLILDVSQMNNLYELILREEAGRSAKRAYKELYNKDYLRKIEEKEKQFEEEAKKLNLSAAMVINSNYWRVEGIREVYTAFYQIITEIFEKELEEFEVATEETNQEENAKAETVELELPQATTIEKITAEENENSDKEAEDVESINENKQVAKEETIEESKENIEEMTEDEEDDEFTKIAEQIDELEDDEETIPVEEDEEFVEDDIPYEDESIDEEELEESLLEPILKAKEKEQDLKAALAAVKEINKPKKKKSGILKNLMKLNTKSKKVEG